MKIIKKLIFFLLMALAGIFILAAISFFMTRGQPKITVDYLAEYNRISRPDNYDPNQNAKELYAQAIDSFFKMPRKLAKISAEWPNDLNQADRNLLQNWLIANTDSLQKFREASQRPYYWVESRAFDNDLRCIRIFELYDFSDIYEATLWNAKNNAINGKYSKAFDDLLVCYRASFQKCDTSRFIIVFRDSLQHRQWAVRATSLILKKTQVPVSVLSSFQRELEEIADTYKFPPDLTANKLFPYDILQRMYIYKPDGSGRLSWEGIKDFSGYCASCGTSAWQITKFWFAGPTQKEVKSQIDLYYKQVEATFTMTPWQLHQTQPDFFENLYRPRFETLFLITYAQTYRRYFHDYYKTQAQLQALLTTIAIQRFHHDKGHLPGQLDELVNAGYLRQSPADPYSDKPLIYNVEGEDFKIYSVGENFKDDGGKRTDDIIFWPPWERPKYSEPNQPIQEPNQPEQKHSE